MQPSFVTQAAIQQAFDLALQHHQAGRWREAEILYRQILSQRPDHAGAMHYLGLLAHQAGRNEAAVALMRGAIALRPGYPQAHYNLGNLLAEMGQTDDAIAAYRQVIALWPGYALAHSNLGNVLKDKGQLDEAVAAYRLATALDPADVTIESNLLFALNFCSNIDARMLAEEHRRWNRQHAEPLAGLILVHSNDRAPERRLRIGYVSPDFRGHCQSMFTIPLLSHHDHEAFEIFCYSSVTRPNEYTRRIAGCADCWREVRSLSDQALCDLIRADGIDILVDLTMHMAGGRPLLFARKPAPVQVAWLAYPGTTGLSAIDHRLSDPYLDPPGMDESVYSEQTIRLPDSFWCYDPLDGREIAVNELPALERGFVTFGCLNNFCKVNDDVLALWARVMRQVERSRLLLYARQGNHRQRALDQLRAHGIEPTRIEFVAHQPRTTYLKECNRIDIGLDTFPYNGHTTTLDCLWMGVPVVTLVGNRVVARAGWCQLSNLGLTELAAQTPDEFVKIAVELAGDLPRLGRLRSTLRQRMQHSPLMDWPRFALNVEAAYRQMWRNWCDPP